MATFCTVPSTNCSKTLHSSLIFLHASSPCIYAALLHPIPEKSKMITCNFVKIEHPCCCGIMADRHPAYIECSRVKRMKSLQQNSLFPPKDRRPLSLSSLLLGLSIHIPAPKAGGGPGLARVHSFPGASPPRHAAGAIYTPLPALAIPHHKRSRAQASRSTTPSSAPVPACDQQDQHVLLRRQLRVRRRLQVHLMHRVGILSNLTTHDDTLYFYFP